MSLTRIIRSAPIISAIAIYGCNGKPDKISLDQKFSKEEADLVAAAQREWLEASDSNEMVIPISLNFNSERQPYGSELPEDEAVAFKISSAHPGYESLKMKLGFDPTGYSLELTEMVFVEDNIGILVKDKVHSTYEEAFYRVALHEYGHFLGLEHLEEPTSIMASLIYVGMEICVDQKTLDYYCSINDCGPKKHPTCSGNKK